MSTRRAPDTPPPGDSTPARGGDQAPAVRALAREVGQLAAGVAQLTEKAGRAEDTANAAARAATTLSDAVRDLYDRGGRDTGDQGDDGSGSGRPTPPWWNIDAPDQASAILADLVDWIADVYVRYIHDPDPELPGCWPLHPDVVTELVALRDAHHAAYHGKYSSPAAVLDWHDRWRPGTAKRVGQVLRLCSLDKHATGGGWDPPTRPGREVVDVAATWWASTRGASAPPAPSPDVIAAERGRRSARDQDLY